LSGLLFAQLALGLGAYLGKFVVTLPAALAIFVRTSHVVVGALMLACGVVLTLRSFRMLPQGNPVRTPGLVAASEEIPA
jgi:threonine/homoserine/homoserine lactone efflux protein